MRKSSSKKGFTLIEVVTSVAIAGLVAVMALPNFLRVRQNVNEGAVQEALKTIHYAMTSYREANFAYPSDLSQLTSIGSGGPAYLDGSLAGGTRLGYRFVIETSNADIYLVRATPQTPGVTGNLVFTLNQEGTIQASSPTSLWAVTSDGADIRLLSGDP